MSKAEFKYSLNIALNVRQSTEAIQFYQDTLGLGLVSHHEGKGLGTEMSAGPMALWIDDTTGSEKDVGQVFFEFKTNNLEEARNLLQEKGATILGETKTDKIIGFMVADPYGMRFHVYTNL